MKEYPCTSCGACCRRIDKIVEGFNKLDKLELNFPYKWDETGRCEKLVGDLCSVYEDRPLICNIEKVAAYFDLSRVEFFIENIKVCNRLMDEEGLDEKFRITTFKK
jgi:uncharacterized protein